MATGAPRISDQTVVASSRNGDRYVTFYEETLADLLRFCAQHHLDPERVVVSYGGDPYIPAILEWKVET